MIIEYIKPENFYRANAKFQTGRRRTESNKRLIKVWHCIVNYMAHGQREFEIKDIAEDIGLSANSVRYHLGKLIDVGAVRVRQEVKKSGKN